MFSWVKRAFKFSLKWFAITATAICGLLLVWTLTSIFYIRLLVSPDTVPTREAFDENVAFSVDAHFNKIEFYNNFYSGHAILTWIKGTNLFLTNEHVAKRMCVLADICSFESPQNSPNKLEKRVCLPGEDICALSPVGESFETKNFKFARTAPGETVFYRNIASKDLVNLGTVRKVDASAIWIDGFSRHGYSGSPVFNKAGEVLGIIRQIEDSRFLTLPHILIFEWTNSNSFSAATWPDMHWINQPQDELDKTHWEKVFSEFKHDIGENPCESDGQSLITITRFLFVAKFAKNSLATKLSDNFARDLEEGDASLQDICKLVL